MFVTSKINSYIVYDLFFIYRLFEEHAELLNLFEKFKELKTKEDQANSLELQEHATTVMNTLDEGIKGLDNLDAFFEYLYQVGASHRRIPGFKVEYFWVSYKYSSIDLKQQKGRDFKIEFASFIIYVGKSFFRVRILFIVWLNITDNYNKRKNNLRE